MARRPVEALGELPKLAEGVTLIDSHCHLDMDEFDADRPAVLSRAAAAGVTTMVTIGAGVSVDWNDHMRWFAGYDGQVSEQQDSHGGSGGVEIRW